MYQRGLAVAKSVPTRRSRDSSIGREQSDRFIETARELGCDESEEAFERTFAKVVPPTRPKKEPGASRERKDSELKPSARPGKE